MMSSFKLFLKFAIRYFYKYDFIIGSILFSGSLLLLGLLLFKSQRQEYLLSMYTNTVFVAVTVFILDTRSEMRARKSKIHELIREMGGQSNEFALKAVNELKKIGCEEGGSGYDLLTGNNLSSANLEKADLSFLNLDSSDLSFANLKKTKMLRTYLRYSNLYYANLQNCCIEGTLYKSSLINAKIDNSNLFLTNMEFANLNNASLTNSWLIKTKLRGTDFSGANLTGSNFGESNLEDAIMSVKTTLPNGEKWKHGYDLKKFSKLDHPQYHTYNDKELNQD